MRLTASITPPEEAVGDLLRALESARLPASELDWVDTAQLRLRVGDFGSVTRADARAVTALLQRRLAEIASPRLSLSGIDALPEEGDDSVWVGLGAEDAQVPTEVAGSILSWVREIGFVPDRRSYRPRIRLARVNARTEVATLERLVNDLGGYVGPEWVARSVVLGAEVPQGPDRPARFDPFDEAPFGRGS